MRRTRCFLALVWLLSWGIFTGWAQMDSVKRLESVEISARRLIQSSIGKQVQTIDSLDMTFQLAGNLADLLAGTTHGYFKVYGPTGLVTPSFRGSGASHTNILLNGISLQSPMNGQQDLSLIPVFLLDDVKVQYGGSSARYGSGAIGGSIHLDSRFVEPMSFRAGGMAELGSFGFQQYGVKLAASSAHVQYQAKGFFRTAENDFLFQPSDNEARIPRTHNGFTQKGGMQDVAISLGNHHRLTAHLWGVESSRDLHPVATQWDLQFRSSLAWEYQQGRWDMQTRLSYLDESLRYTDSVAAIFSDSRAGTWLGEWNADVQLSDAHALEGSIRYQRLAGTSDGYQGNTYHQSRISAWASWRAAWLSGRLKTLASLRQMWVSDQSAPFTPALGFEYLLASEWRAGGHVGRNFRMPTFNDWYWNPGGNPDLRPETGWSQEAFVSWDRSLDTRSFAVKTTAFNSQVKDWIIWLPQGAFWSPENIQQVWSRGLELDGHWTQRMGDAGLEVGLLYSWTKSTNQKAKSTFDRSLHKQLIYTPEHQGTVTLGFAWRTSSVQYRHRLVGQRFTTTDNSDTELPATHVANLVLSHPFRWNQISCTLTGRLDNLWNQSYQWVAGQPMPGRSWQLGLQIFFEGLPKSSS
ncbi:TonB-dependent receptor domain-containing protein [Pontibacter sp. G13]|uniref:TonB-dependent receptor n=1 Tax=Pontibacter sp. G13 TaxID=3074898 RepID=UPI002888FBE5|nr:TonB-dependent receptor [Pontibacter sp. G13]WNJ19501.1 TonB-dependent receptor [Pontibacter sp. G13]